MTHFGLLIRRIRQANHLTIHEVARRGGINPDTVWRAEQMDICHLRSASFKRLAAGLGLTPEKLDQLSQGKLPHEALTTPLYDGIPASPPRYVGEMGEYDTDLRVSRSVISTCGLTDPHAYTIVVRGDSMSPTFDDGDIVIVSPGTVHDVGVETGKVYVVWFTSSRDSEGTLKRVRVTPGKWLLVADNPKYRPIEVDSADIAAMALVCGKIVITSHRPPPPDQPFVPSETDPAFAGQFNDGAGPLKTVDDVEARLKLIGRRPGDRSDLADSE